MNAPLPLLDEVFERFLAERAGVGAPGHLAASIGDLVARSPQRRAPRHFAPRLLRGGGRLARLAWVAALLGLLLAASVAAAIVGGELLRRANEPVVLVEPTMPSATAPAQTPFVGVTQSAFGPITWSTIDAPDTEDLWFVLLGTPHGPVAIDWREVGEGHADELRWPTPDGAWGRLPFGDSRSLDDYFVVGNDVLAGGAQPFWVHRSGSDWVKGEPLDLDGAMDVNQVAVGPRGTVISDGTAIQYATDGRHFVRATQPPDKAKVPGWALGCESWQVGHDGGEGAIGPIVATTDGFIALTAAAAEGWSAWPVCEPLLWSSEDGSSWDLVSPVSPFGAGASVREVAGHDGRLVAIGQLPPTPGAWNAWWVSDNGLTWERVPTPEPVGPCPVDPPGLCGHIPTRVVAGDAGWFVVDGEGFAWTSIDGRTWMALVGGPQIPAGWTDQEVALSPGSIVVTNAGADKVIGTFTTR